MKDDTPFIFPPLKNDDELAELMERLRNIPIPAVVVVPKEHDKILADHLELCRKVLEQPVSAPKTIKVIKHRNGDEIPMELKFDMNNLTLKEDK